MGVLLAEDPLKTLLGVIVASTISIGLFDIDLDLDLDRDLEDNDEFRDEQRDSSFSFLKWI